MIVIAIPAVARPTPNLREKWQQRHHRVAGERAWLRATILNELEKPDVDRECYINMAVEHHLPTRHRRDLDNLDAGIKSWLDELFAWLGVDDERVIKRYSRRIYKSERAPLTVIRLASAVEEVEC